MNETKFRRGIILPLQNKNPAVKGELQPEGIAEVSGGFEPPYTVLQTVA
jgi:hypothetical protein